MPAVFDARAVVTQLKGPLRDTGEARGLPRSHDERLPLSESAQFPGRDPSVNGLVRVPGSHDARREGTQCRARRGEPASEGSDDDDASAPGLGQERGPQSLRLRGSKCLRQIRTQLRGVRYCQDRGSVAADALQQIDDAGRVHRQMGGRAIDCLLADDVERLAGAVRDARREG